MNAQAVSIDVDMLAQLPAKTMLQFIERRQETEKYLRECALLLKDSSEFFRKLEQIEGLTIRFDADYCYVSISFSGNGQLFTQIWHELRLEGYVPGARPKKGDTSYSAYWKRPGYPTVFVNFTSSVCKQVQVGTKLVEQPVYETQCGDPLPEIEADNVVAIAAPAPSESLPL